MLRKIALLILVTTLILPNPHAEGQAVANNGGTTIDFVFGDVGEPFNGTDAFPCTETNLSNTYLFEGTVMGFNDLHSTDWSMDDAIPLIDLLAEDEPIVGYTIILEPLDEVQSETSLTFSDDKLGVVFVGPDEYYEVCPFEVWLTTDYEQ